MTVQAVGAREIGQGQLWFGLLGGAVAWTIHLLVAYALGEFGCVAGWGHLSFLGITAVAWAVILESVVMALIAGAATYLGYRNEQRLREGLRSSGEGLDEGAHPKLYMARAGWIFSSVFLFVIVFETVPIFFFLNQC